jgi:hypothetical protein
VYTLPGGRSVPYAREPVAKETVLNMRCALIPATRHPRPGALASKLLFAVLANLLASPSWPNPDSSADATQAQTPVQEPTPATATTTSTTQPSRAPVSTLAADIKRWLTPATWFNPATAPFIPVPLIAVDPDSGTTLGLLPVRLQTDENNDIRRILAPDVLYNPLFWLRRTLPRVCVSFRGRAVVGGARRQ